MPCHVKCTTWKYQSRTFTMLGTHHRRRDPEHVFIPKETPDWCSSHSLFPSSPAPGNCQTTSPPIHSLSLQIRYSQHSVQMESCNMWSSVSGFFHSASFRLFTEVTVRISTSFIFMSVCNFRWSSMSLCAWVVSSFLLLRSIPLCVYTRVCLSSHQDLLLLILSGNIIM